MILKHLRTLHMYNPIGIDGVPYFSWMMESEKNDVLQEAYAIKVKTTDEQILWNTGWIQSDENSFILYAGEKLKSRTRYKWSVEVKNNHGETAQESAWFETAILNETEWEAAWVEDTLPIEKRECGFGNQPPATMFRKNFHIETEKEIAIARVYATAHGVYHLYINGKKVGNREMAPGYASYEKRMPYQTYDIAEYLKENKNVLGMYVGDGWYFSPETTMSKEKTKLAHHAILFELHIEYKDGTSEVVLSDEEVKASYGPVLSTDLFAGEKHDANRECSGWNTVDYDDSTWSSVKTCDNAEKHLSAEADDIICPAATFQAKEILETPNGDKIIDFGQNMAGRVRMHCCLPKSYKLVIEHFEALDQDGNYFNTILSTNGVGAGADQRVEYISNGKETEYEPFFTYLGFRYIRIKCYDAEGNELTGNEFPDMSADDFCAVALSTRKENTGTFECSDTKLNQLYSNIRWSQYSNMLSIPTDCPQREKAGWTGDAAIYIETALLNEDVTPLFTRWMESVSADQQVDGMIPMVVPFNDTYQSMAVMMGQMTQMNGLATSAGWGDVSVKVPWTMYDVTGNRSILEKQYHTMNNWCDYIINQAAICRREDLPKEKEQYLWNTGFHYGEWLIPSTSAAGFADQQAVGMAMAMTSLYTAPIYGYYSVSTFAKIARLLNKDKDYAHYSQIADKMKDAIQSCLIGPNGEPPAEYMGAYVLLLYFDLVPERFKKQYEEHLVRMIEQNGKCLDTGFLATPYLMDVLDKMGRTDLAYDLLFQTKSPSWLYEVEHGATTIWETWNAVNEQGEPQHVSMNHYSFGCVAEWMFKTIGGIRRGAPGYKHLLIAPKMDERIQWAKREYLTEQGTVSCKWERDECEVKLKIQIPCNSTATIILPDGTKKEVGSGNYMYIWQIHD